MWTRFCRLPLFATLVTFISVVIMFALGIWQLQRAEQKELRLTAIQQVSQSSGMSLQQVVNSNTESMLDVPVTFKGEPDTTHFFLIDNKIHQGRVGYQVLVPVRTDHGVLLTNYGWVAATNSRDILPQVDIETKNHLFAGIVSIPTNNAMVTETAKVDAQWPKVLQQINLNVALQHYKQPLLPFIVLLNQQQDSQFVRNWQPVVMPPEKHIGYALQWFLLAIAALGVFIFAHRTKLKGNDSE